MLNAKKSKIFFKISSNTKIFIVSSSRHHFTGEYSQLNKVRKYMVLKEKKEIYHDLQKILLMSKIQNNQ